MNVVLILQLIGAIGGGAIIQGLVSYLKDRRQIKIKSEVSERTKEIQVEAIGIAGLQAQLVYLQGVIKSLDESNRQKDAQLKDAWQRIRELEHEVRDVRIQARDLDAKCYQLQKQLREYIEMNERSHDN